MNINERLFKTSGASLPVILQTEATECGLICIGMIAAYHNLHIDIRVLRQHFPVSLKGVRLSQLIKMANRFAMTTRAIKADLHELSELRLPCILHLNFNHFVVLKEIHANSAIVHDPARGVRSMSIAELSDAFTGIALECWPTTEFVTNTPIPQLKLRHLLGRVVGVKRSLTQILILALVLEIFSVMSPIFLQLVLDNVIVSHDRDLLATLALGFGILMFLQLAVSTSRAWVGMHMETTLTVQLRSSVFTHLLSLPIQYFEKRHLGDVISRFGAVDMIQQTLTASFVSGILDGLMTLVTLSMMFLYSPMLGSIAIFTIILYASGRWCWYYPLRSASEELIVRSAKTQSHFLESMRGVRSIKLFQREDDRRSAWLTLLIDQVNVSLSTQKMELFYRQFNGLLFGIATILVIWLGASMVMDGNFTVGMLVAFSSYKSQFEGRVSGLVDNFFALKMVQLQGERLADIVLTSSELEPFVKSGEKKEYVGRIELCDLTYRYTDEEPIILNGINLTINAGESIAIVGPTGCGKTTLINIMLGILSPTSGEVRIDGIALADIGIDVLRGMTGTVMQDDVLFAGSITDNISFFDESVDPAWVVECAKFAEIHDEISQMPMGYNTLVGDMGSVLSGGQKQCILIARALYKRPKIVFLDEATCHLDIEREMRVAASIRSCKISRVIVAHRSEAINSVDRIITLGSGMIVSDGMNSFVQADCCTQLNRSSGNPDAYAI